MIYISIWSLIEKVTGFTIRVTTFTKKVISSEKKINMLTTQ